MSEISTNSVSRRSLLFQSHSAGDLELLSVQSHAIQVDQQFISVLTAGTLWGNRGVHCEDSSVRVAST